MRKLILILSLALLLPVRAAQQFTVAYANIDETGWSTACGNELLVDDGSVFTVTSGNPTRDGATFVGWFDAPEGGNPFASGQSIVIHNHTTIYAQWQTTPTSAPSALYARPSYLTKVLISGHLYFQHNEQIYDITGQRLR